MLSDFKLFQWAKFIIENLKLYILMIEPRRLAVPFSPLWLSWRGRISSFISRDSQWSVAWENVVSGPVQRSTRQVMRICGGLFLGDTRNVEITSFSKDTLFKSLYLAKMKGHTAIQFFSGANRCFILVFKSLFCDVLRIRKKGTFEWFTISNN